MTHHDREHPTELPDAELLQLERELREEFYAAERAATPTGDSRRPSVHERPELLKAYERWDRVSTLARRRGLGEHAGEMR